MFRHLDALNTVWMTGVMLWVIRVAHFFPPALFRAMVNTSAQHQRSVEIFSSPVICRACFGLILRAIAAAISARMASFLSYFGEVHGDHDSSSSFDSSALISALGAVELFKSSTNKLARRYVSYPASVVIDSPFGDAFNHVQFGNGFIPIRNQGEMVEGLAAA